MFNSEFLVQQKYQYIYLQALKLTILGLNDIKQKCVVPEKIFHRYCKVDSLRKSKLS